MGILLLRSLASILKQILADAASDIIPNPQQQQLSSQSLPTLPPGTPFWQQRRRPGGSGSQIPRRPLFQDGVARRAIIHCQTSRRSPLGHPEIAHRLTPKAEAKA